MSTNTNSHAAHPHEYTQTMRPKNKERNGVRIGRHSQLHKTVPKNGVTIIMYIQIRYRFKNHHICCMLNSAAYESTSKTNKWQVEEISSHIFNSQIAKFVLYYYTIHVSIAPIPLPCKCAASGEVQKVLYWRR